MKFIFYALIVFSIITCLLIIFVQQPSSKLPKEPNNLSMEQNVPSSINITTEINLLQTNEIIVRTFEATLNKTNNVTSSETITFRSQSPTIKNIYSLPKIEKKPLP